MTDAVEKGLLDQSFGGGGGPIKIFGDGAELGPALVISVRATVV